MRKNVIYVSLILIGIGIVICLLNIVRFSLKGDEVITMLEGSKYVEIGYNAKTLLGRNISNKVKVSNNINTNVVGTYYVEYNLKYFFVRKKLRREVNIVKSSIDIFDIVLDGKPVIYQEVGDIYEEKGGYALNKITNTKSNFTKVEGKVDINHVGEYEIKYQFEYGGELKEKTRKVVVYGFNTEIVKDISEKAILVNVEITGINDLEYVKLPDGKKEFSKNFLYEIGNTGLYIFKFYTKDNTEILYQINMDNRDKYECSGKINRNGTQLEILGDNGLSVKSYQWIIDGKEESGTNKYRNSNSIKEAKVILTLKSGLTEERNCTIEDELVYHFKYDENNLKPFMRCNTYTLADKVELEGKLQKVVADAGYGTRAGVVEAARFLVGALDYKVPYLGPKDVNDVLGRYKKIGLNIANSNGWGCNVSGWTQGMDCTNFVEWAFYQNGIKTHPYTKGHDETIPIASALRVGDLLFTPCEVDCENKTYGLSHVGIIIGVDDNYFYVAESTTGSINAIVVTKWEKNNMPKKGKFSWAKIWDYGVDGNVTDMWVE